MDGLLSVARWTDLISLLYAAGTCGHPGTLTCTLGVLSYQEARLAFTLGDPVRDNRKIAGRPAIPAGIYQLFWRTDGTRGPRYRERFGTPGVLPLRDVRFFEGIQIH